MEKELLELTNPQKSIWLTSKVYSDTSINNICSSMVINEVINFKALKKAVNLFVEKNDSFNIKIVEENGVAKQYVSDFVPFDIELMELNSINDVNKVEENLTSTRFNLTNSLLFKFIMFKFPDGHGGLALVAHHLIFDAWTSGLVINEIIDIYASLTGRTELDTLDFPTYVEYIKSEKEYLQSERFIKDETFWKETFESVPEVASIPSVKESVPQKFAFDANREQFTISKTLVNSINEFCTNNKISVFNFFMAIFSVYLGRVSNLNEFVIGTPILNRSSFKEKNTTGMFISMVPFKISISENETFINLTSNISKQALSVFRHQKYPYQYLLEHLRKDNSSLPNLFDVIFSYQNVRSNKQSAKVSFDSRWVANNAISDSIDIHVCDMDDTGSLNIVYDYLTSKYCKEDIQDINNRIVNMINQVLVNNTIEVKNIEIVTPEEKHQILYDFNNTTVDYPKDKTISQLFEEQTLKTPDNIAVVFEDQKLTYKELNEKANSLAHYLQEKGIVPNDLVGIMVNRSLEMIVGILAVLKSGAAYIPIDPEYPADRISYMLENSNAKLLLLHSKTLALSDGSHAFLDISLDNSIIYNNNFDNLNLNLPNSSLMYMIYTSGSTGLPKGVMLTHKNIANFITGMTNVIDFNPNKTMVSLTTMCFDIFVLEIWCSLCNGLKVVIANETEQNNLIAFNKLCIKNSVNMLQTTPSRISIFIDDSRENNDCWKNITDVMVGGEAFPKPLLEKLQSITTANIYNMYGPTETAVWSTVKNLTNFNNISIGKPIANTKCYILDSNHKLLPANVPGELYIGGLGVSNGYLKKPELTSEKFIKSPFEDEIIYNTNDLAYFTKSGELIHLGRTDSQVKIRGYRIELGEIENAINQFPNIVKNCVLSINGKYLVCYYISNSQINSSSLASSLMDSLPTYMIPAYFKRIDLFPFTPNGKIDRKKLSTINFLDEEEIVETYKTATEKNIVTAVLKLLKQNETTIDVNTPFFALGFDSLSLIQLQGALICYGFNLTTQDFYKYPSIRKLANYIDSNTIDSLEIEDDIPEMCKHITSFDPNDITLKNNVLNTVFLTGANGFIGVHVLHEILSTTNSSVYCLVRGDNLKHSIERLSSKYTFYFNENILPLINSRIFIVNGDISYNNFNLTNDEFSKLFENIDTIIHTAAIVKHYGNYNDFEKINIEGTKRVADYAYNFNKRLIHLSSLSVSGNYLVKQDNKNKDFTENDLYIGQHYSQNVYVNSKYIAEKAIYSYIEKGLNAKILRIGIAAGRYSDGVFQENISENAFYNRIKSMILLKKISYTMLDQHIEFSPIDYLAKSIVLLSKCEYGNRNVFHLYNHNLATISQIVELLKNFNVSIETLDRKSFEDFIFNISKFDPENSGLKGIINDLQVSKNDIDINYDFTVNLNSLYTVEVLRALGFEWPICDNEYVNRLLAYMKNVSFI